MWRVHLRTIRVEIPRPCINWWRYFGRGEEFQLHNMAGSTVSCRNNGLHGANFLGIAHPIYTNRLLFSIFGIPVALSDYRLCTHIADLPAQRAPLTFSEQVVTRSAGETRVEANNVLAESRST